MPSMADYKQAEKHIEKEVNAGRLDYNSAARILKGAKKNYQERTWDRQAEREQNAKRISERI